MKKPNKKYNKQVILNKIKNITKIIKKAQNIKFKLRAHGIECNNLNKLLVSNLNGYSSVKALYNTFLQYKK